MFSHQMKLISLHPVSPTASFNLSLLHTHQLIALPGDSRLHVPGGKRGIMKLTTWVQFDSCTAYLKTHTGGNEAPGHSATTLDLEIIC